MIPQLAAELGRSVTRVADSDLTVQARQQLGQEGICAKPNAILKLMEDVTQVYQTSPRHQEKDVAGTLGHTTEKDDRPVRELSIVSTKTHLPENCMASKLWRQRDYGRMQTLS